MWGRGGVHSIGLETPERRNVGGSSRCRGPLLMQHRARWGEEQWDFCHCHLKCAPSGPSRQVQQLRNKLSNRPARPTSCYSSE